MKSGLRSPVADDSFTRNPVLRVTVNIEPPVSPGPTAFRFENRSPRFVPTDRRTPFVGPGHAPAEKLRPRFARETLRLGHGVASAKLDGPRNSGSGAARWRSIARAMQDLRLSDEILSSVRQKLG
jgi:hypothetical protein